MAIVRGTDGAAAAKAALAAMEEGFRYVEIALTTPGALEAIREVRAAAPPGCFVGAGTVLTVQDVDRGRRGRRPVHGDAVAGGVDQLNRPGRGIPVLAGALTPSEAYEAMNRGATAVKLFPASIGGPGYLKALRDPFPEIPFIAVGGWAWTRPPATGKPAPSPSGSAGRCSATPAPAATSPRCGSAPAASWTWPPTSAGPRAESAPVDGRRDAPRRR